MAKRKKRRNKVVRVGVKAAKKARRAMNNHGPLTAFLAALGGLATSVISSENVRKAVMRFVDTKLGGATHMLERVRGGGEVEEVDEVDDIDDVDELDGRGGEAHA
jgi:hypothetical protein